jgi:hypothetical protein
MTKKIWLFVLSFITILWIWISFADIIEPNTHYVDRCVKFQNVEIDNYRVIVENYGPMTDEIYEPQANQCLEWYYQFAESTQYLLDKSIDIEGITHENIQDEAIKIWNLRAIWWYVNDSNPLSSETFTYRIIKNWDIYKLEESDTESVKSFENNEIIWDEEDIKPLDEEYIEDETDYALEIVESEEWIELANNNRLVKFLVAWILTILIETIVLFAIAKLFRKEEQISNWRLILTWIFASTITLPLLRFVLPLFIKDGVEYMIIWELLVTIIEVFIIKYWLKTSRWKALIASIMCNVFSFIAWIIVF